MRLSQAEAHQLRLRRPDLFAGVAGLGPTPADQPRQSPVVAGQKPADQSRPRRRPGVPRVRCALIAAVPRRLDPDNLAAALKPYQDAVAAALGIDDGDPFIAWEYEQTETRGHPGVMVKLELEGAG